MKEIEVVVELTDDKEKIKAAFANFNYIEDLEIKDVYFYDPNKVTSKPDSQSKNIGECLRYRVTNGNHEVDYKIDKYDDKGKWLYSDTYEKEVTNIKDVLNSFNASGFKELVTVEKKRKHYKNEKYDIYLEHVKDLGFFIELDYRTSDDVNVYEIKKEMKEFIDKLNLKTSDILTTGKPEMLIKKRNINI